jgi:beta-lactamase class A
MITFLKIAEDDQNYLNQTIEYQRFDGGLSQNILPEKELNEGESYSIGTLIRRMIVYSDNQAMDLLSSYVDENKMEKVFFDLGLRLPDNSSQEDFITTRDYAATFRILYNASYLNREMSEKALKLLSEVSYDNGLAAGLPEGIKIANKFGERAYSDGLEQFHDCGIIYYPDKPYLLCVMTKGTDFGALQQTIREISQAVYRVASF